MMSLRVGWVPGSPPYNYGYKNRSSSGNNNNNDDKTSGNNRDDNSNYRSIQKDTSAKEGKKTEAGFNITTVLTHHWSAEFL